MNKSTTVVIIVALVVVLGGAWLFAKQDKRVSSDTSGAQQGSDKLAAYKENCRDVKIPKGQELDISADSETGLATIGYTDENGQQQEVILYYKDTSGCSEDAKRVLLQIQANEKSRP